MNEVWNLSWPLSVLLRYTDSDYPFGIFKLFFTKNNKQQHLNANDLTYPLCVICILDLKKTRQRLSNLDLCHPGFPVLGSWIFMLRIERTWWRLFKKRVLGTRLDLWVFFTFWNVSKFRIRCFITMELGNIQTLSRYMFSGRS